MLVVVHGVDIEREKTVNVVLLYYRIALNLSLFLIRQASLLLYYLVLKRLVRLLLLLLRLIRAFRLLRIVFFFVVEL